MPDFDLTVWGPWIISTTLALIFGIDRALAALERIGRLPERWQQWNRKRVEEIAARDRQDRALAALARIEPQLIGIAEQLSENGGDSLFDKVDIMAAQVKAVAAQVNGLAENVAAHVVDSAADSALLRTVDRQLAEHIIKTDPLVVQYERDLAERAQQP
jgi:DNA-binding FrmR family transcriptional regulator